jgi:hypothetical protein
MTKTRVMVLFFAALFTLAFHAMYVAYLVPVWKYWGFRYYPADWPWIAFTFCISVLPAAWLVVHMRRPSHLIVWVLYLTVYVPSVMVPVFTRYERDSKTASLLLCMLAGFFLMDRITRLKPIQLPRISAEDSLMWSIAMIVAIALTAYVLVSASGGIRMVNFSDVYAYRTENQQDGFINYAELWLVSVFYPLMITRGLDRRRWKLVVLGSAGQLFLYSVMAMKSVILSVPLFLVVYFVVRRARNYAGIVVPAGATALIGIAFLTSLIDAPWAFMVGAVVLMRTFGTPGLCTYQYDEFFQNNPWTYLSHAKGFNLIVHYPYDRPIYFEMGRYFYNAPELSNNTHFFAQDGIASFGLLGIIAISALAGLIFWILDSAAQGHSRLFSCLLVVYTSINVANVSLFTSLISGGVVLIVLIFLILRGQTPGPLPRRFLPAAA